MEYMYTKDLIKQITLTDIKWKTVRELRGFDYMTFTPSLQDWADFPF